MVTKWEYATLAVEFDGKHISLKDTERVTGFDSMGKQGWELVTVQQINGEALAFFKRERMTMAQKRRAGISPVAIMADVKRRRLEVAGD
jgi:hypothetical protein